MKKLLALTFVFSMLPAFSFDGLPDVPINPVTPMNDMQTMQEAKFRHEELDYYNDDVQEAKAKFKKRNANPEEQAQQIKDQINQAVDQKYNKVKRIQN